MNSAGLKSFVESRRTVLVCLGLAAATLLVYWQVAVFEFTNFDEFQMVLQNPYVLAGVTPRGVWWALTTSWFEYWHPLTWLSHMLDCELFGLNAGWHHLSSVGFHVANTLLLYLGLQRMTGAWKRSAIVAALFALHPLHVESVAWIAERKDVLSAFFFLLSLWAYVRYAEDAKTKAESRKQKAEIPDAASPVLRSSTAEGGRITFHVSRFTFHPSSVAALRRVDVSRFYLLSLFFFACGLMSKPMVVTLPFVLLLLDYWPLRRNEEGRMMNAECRIPPATINYQLSTLFRLLFEKLPFFVLSAASCLITYLGARAGGNVLSAAAVPWGLRLANVPVSYARYLGKLIWPTDLLALYPMPSHLAWWQVFGSVGVLVLITLFVVWRARSAPYWIVGWLFFLGMLLPTIGLVQVGSQSIADRYTYLPYIGLFIAVVWGVADGQSNVQSPMSKVQSPGDKDYGLRTTDHGPRTSDGTSPVLRNSTAEGGRFTFHVSRFTIRGSLLLGGAAVVLILCGHLSWVQVGTWRNSFTLWTHCLAVCPDSLFARYNLGYVLQHSGKTGEAIEQYRAALRLKPDHADSNLNLGIALIGTGRAQEATNYLATALRVKPEYARAQGAMGLALYELHDYAGAITHCTEAVRLDPDDFGPYVNLARALGAQGKSDDALRYYAEALRLNPALAQTHYYLGLEWMKRGEYGQAAASFGEAVRLAPLWKEAKEQWEQAQSKAAGR